ncbi:DUF488 family protein [Janibacter indicus]|uniref:DUF488 family protein n=1 Tax=Janibacter indicus TaxID=857417 RepID=UPI003EBD5B4E
MHQLRTIGVYGFDASSFLDSLNKAGVTMLLDVRQRRGVRGTQYAWANSQRLQASLAAAGIGYWHRRDLAPTTELRQLQYAEDARQGVSKRTRRELAPAYVDRYTAEVLAHAASSRSCRRCRASEQRPCSASSAIPRPVTVP